MAAPLNFSDRLAIESGLMNGKTINAIARAQNRHTSTITREIMVNREEQFNQYSFGNDCLHVTDCVERNVCGDKRCNYLCRSCRKLNYPGYCHKFCKKYLAVDCLELTKPPYVCNNCRSKDRCIKNKYFYSAVAADKRSKLNRSRTRNATRLTEADIKRLDKLISPLINKGQPLIHIMAQHKEEIPVSIRTIYSYIEKGFFSIKNIDLRRKVGYKPRRKPRKKDLSGYAVQAYLVGRKYSDFKEYLLEFEDDSAVVEMDTVLGTKSSRKRILTMTFRRNNLMLMFLLSDGKASSVVNIFRYLEHELGLDCFRRVFKIFLTDNGGEFKDNINLEYTKENDIRTKVYYCDPMASWQKGCAEKNHEFIRYAIPKGTSLGPFTSEDITLLMNHINSVKREIFGGKSPYELLKEEIKHGDNDMQKLMEVMHMEEVPPDEIILTPKLFK
ncbi:MAG: IS30 family transposase [Phascolarctobacterium sp.]|nr:IS30 family transposase [Phascolarctobacterium sp.]